MANPVARPSNVQQTRSATIKAPTEFDELANPAKAGTLSNKDVEGLSPAAKTALVKTAATRIPQVSNQVDV
jgi:hypothetical protein